MFKCKLLKNITCEFVKHDKFGGRLLGNIYIDGVSLADILIKAGLAREYHGEKKKSWCDAGVIKGFGREGINE